MELCSTNTSDIVCSNRLIIPIFVFVFNLFLIRGQQTGENTTTYACIDGNNRINAITTFINKPLQVLDLDKILITFNDTAVNYHSMTLTDSGVVCWGFNDFGQCDVCLNNVSQISAGNYHSMALTNSGIVCWGGNYYGQCDVPNLL